MKYLSMLAGSLLLSGMFAGCVREEVLVSEDGDGIYELAEDEYGLGVTLSLSQLTGGSTRAALGDLGEAGLKDIEEFVNTDNLYILFFSLDGTFLFQINKPVAVPIGQSALGNDCQWFIRIPVKEINDNLIHYIEEHPFKIAVLANWTFDSDINLGGDLGGWDEFRFNEPLDAEGNLTYNEDGTLKGDHISLLSHAERDTVYESEALKGGYYHLVHYTGTGPHMGPYTEWVRNYHKSINEADADIRAYYDVKSNTYSNPQSKYVDANGKLTANNHFKMAYNNIWQVWYFGTDDSHFDFDNKETGAAVGAQQKQDWLDLNMQAKKDLITGMYEEMMNDDYGFMRPVPVGSPLNFKWTLPNYSSIEFASGVTVRYTEIPDNDLLDGTHSKDEIVEAMMKFDAVILDEEHISYKDNEAGNPLNLNEATPMGGYHPYIRFKAHADGYVRVLYEATGGAQLWAHVGTNNTPANNASGYQKDNKSNRFQVNEEGYLVKTAGGSKQIADIPFDPKNVYLYMVVDPDYVPADNGEGAEDGDEPEIEEPMVTIYGIEYIESRHLYDADRSAVLPSKDYPIPMYGIQDFDPIGEYWEPGVLFNLSQFNNAQKLGYNYRNISLLRSLARVEVKLLKSAFPQKPSHVFMRSMNRSARITPVDFLTPTDIIWNGFNASSVSDVRRLQNYINEGILEEQRIIENTPGIAKEIENIMQYGPIYIGTNANLGQSDKQMLDEYRKTTAWPFGIWEHQWGWDWNSGKDVNGVHIDEFETYQVGQTRAHTNQVVPEYPRILHPRISRSDYARFTEVDDPQYWHYIMYIPEKNITDADNPGNIADRPKIIHVELRFNGGPDDGDTSNDEDNFVDNFDDRAAYRLYFTPGGRANLGSFDFTGRESWDAYEYDWKIASQHWPIMRNHVYVFTVNGAPSHSGNVDFKVNAPDQREANYEFY